MAKCTLQRVLQVKSSSGRGGRKTRMPPERSIFLERDTRDSGKIPPLCVCSECVAVCVAVCDKRFQPDNSSVCMYEILMPPLFWMPPLPLHFLFLTSPLLPQPHHPCHKYQCIIRDSFVTQDTSTYLATSPTEPTPLIGDSSLVTHS